MVHLNLWKLWQLAPVSPISLLLNWILLPALFGLFLVFPKMGNEHTCTSERSTLWCQVLRTMHTLMHVRTSAVLKKYFIECYLSNGICFWFLLLFYWSMFFFLKEDEIKVILSRNRLETLNIDLSCYLHCCLIFYIANKDNLRIFLFDLWRCSLESYHLRNNSTYDNITWSLK